MAKGFMRIYWDPNAINRIMRNLRQVDTNMREGAKTALTQVAKGIMAQSALECPYDTGALVSSGYIENPIETLTSVSCKIGYGPPNDHWNAKEKKWASEYALEVHETPEYHHPIGKWKFLEDPVRQYQAQFLNVCAGEIRARMSAGVSSR